MLTTTRLILLTVSLLAIAIACNNPESPDYKQKVFDRVDEMPIFPGGQDSLAAWLQRTISYPSSALADSVQGTTVIGLIIDDTGAVDTAWVEKGFHPDCDQVALQAVQNMPRWAAGNFDGLNVKVRLSLPVSFTLP